jgi:hypothetical protein
VLGPALVCAPQAVKREGIREQMEAAQEADVPERPTGGPLAVMGAALAYTGFAAIAVSAGWTTAVHPFSEPGLYQRHMFGLLALVLVGAAAIGRGALTAKTAGKLLCALGAAVCMSVAVDPTLESVGSLGERLPTWLLDAYPGLATLGWIVAAVGALVWWLSVGRAGEARLYRFVVVVGAIVLGVAAVGLRSALLSAGYDVPAHPTGLFVWRVVETGAVLATAMAVCGERRFSQWPMLIFGIGLAVHVGRGFVGSPLE